MSNAFYISSGHGKYVRGASGFIDEVDEARKVANEVARILKADYKATGYVFHDDTSRSQGVNLNTIVKAHNSKERGIDVSVHFNAATASATGVEVLHYGNRAALATKMSAAMAKALGLRDRGEKKRADLAFLRGTNRPAILLEVCFVSNRADAEAYRKNFDDLCEAIAGVMADFIGAKKAASSKVEPAKASAKTHKVVKGDTLYAIARKYKTTVAAIKKANALKSDDLSIGQTLKIK